MLPTELCRRIWRARARRLLRRFLRKMATEAAMTTSTTQVAIMTPCVTLLDADPDWLSGLTVADDSSATKITKLQKKITKMKILLYQTV